jgi:hypothetical protein
MVSVFRNLILCFGLAVAAYACTMFVDLETVEGWLPAALPFRSREMVTVTIAFSVGVFVTSAALAALATGSRARLWPIGYAVFWFLLALFPSVALREVYRGESVSSTIVWGAAEVWPAAIVLVAGLLGARLAWWVHESRRRADA